VTSRLEKTSQCDTKYMTMRTHVLHQCYCNVACCLYVFVGCLYDVANCLYDVAIEFVFGGVCCKNERSYDATNYIHYIC
jgi:hypothetical protein